MGYQGKRTRAASVRTHGLPATAVFAAAGIAAAVLLVIIIIIAAVRNNRTAAEVEAPSLSVPEYGETDTEPAEEPEPEPEPVEEAIVYEPFQPYCTENTDPVNFIKYTAIEVNGEAVDSYTAEEEITFGPGSEYTELTGIVTFRGSNFRNSSSYGTAEITEGTMTSVWKQSVASLNCPGGTSWSGCGWTGQPLIVTWPKETRAVMNLYDWAKEADTLTEVIYAAEDGHIYFMELETGKATRDILNMGFCFKGSGSLDPRGYPVLYVGSGYNSYNGTSRAFAISLIDCSVLFSFGNGDSFADRDWYCFDSAPLVDAETDTLIWPGEDGVLYFVRLNMEYDEAAGTLTADPTYVKWKYRGLRTTSSKFWVGMEDSAAIWQGYLFVADNGGNLMCLDMNTLELVWVQDTWDDTNCSPALSIEDGHPYLYISTSFHLGWRSSSTADIPVLKIDAENGEIVWEQDYNVYSESSLSGGVQGTIAIGEKQLSGLVFVPVAKCGGASAGKIVALSKETGEVVWETSNNSYSWGSPTIVYDKAGNGRLLYATLGGSLIMLDGLTGEVITSMDLGGHCEATVCAFNDMIVIGARTGYIHGIRLS